MKTAFITGANKGIGFELAHLFLQRGYFVYLGSRSHEKGLAAAAQLKAVGFTKVESIKIDVSDQDSVNEAFEELTGKTDSLDVLINNAGVSGGFEQTALTADIGQFREVYETNVYGVVRVTQAFMPLLQKSNAPRIVNVSSSQGSLTLASDPNDLYYNFKYAVYQSSKAALNMYTVNLAYELRDTSFKVNAVCPGFTKTDFNGQQGVGTVEDAAKRIARFAELDDDGPTGKFFSEEINPETAEIPW